MKTDNTRTAYKNALAAKQAVKPATEAQASALEYLKDKVTEWGNLPAALTSERATLAGYVSAEAEARARLTKPLEDYETKRQSWQERRNNRAPEYQNKNAEAVRVAIIRQSSTLERIAKLESDITSGYAAFVKPEVEDMRESILEMQAVTVNFWQSAMTLASALNLTEPYSGKELQEAFEVYTSANPTAKEKKTDARTQAAEKIHDIPTSYRQDGTRVIMADNLVKAIAPFDRATDFVFFIGTEIVCKVETLRDVFKLFEGQVILTFEKSELIARNQNSKTTLKTIHPDNKGMFARLNLAA